MSDAEAPPAPLYEASLSISGPRGSYRLAITGTDSGVSEAAEAALHALNTQPEDPNERLHILARAVVDAIATYARIQHESSAGAEPAATTEGATEPAAPPASGGAEA